jgi:hypothetical protein
VIPLSHIGVWPAEGETYVNFLNLALAAKHKLYRFSMPFPLLVLSKTVLNLCLADNIRDNKILIFLYQGCQISLGCQTAANKNT